MNPLIANGLIDAGGAAFGGLLGAFSTNSNNKRIARENQKNRDFAHNEAILAHNRQLEIMDKTNQWNSFANQRELAEAAGFNPNRIFDTGSSGIATSSGASGGAQASQPSSGYSDPLLNVQMMSAMSDVALKQAQARNLDANTKEVADNAKVQRLLGNSMSAFYESQQNLNEYQLNWLDSTEVARIEYQEKLNRLIGSQSDNYIQQTSVSLYTLHNIMPLEREQLFKIVYDVLPAQVEYLKSSAKLNDAQAYQAVCNGLYLSVLKNKETINYEALKTPEGRKATLDRILAEARYMAEKAANEALGLPYLIDMKKSGGIEILGQGLNFTTPGAYNAKTGQIY